MGRTAVMKPMRKLINSRSGNDSQHEVQPARGEGDGLGGQSYSGDGSASSSGGLKESFAGPEEGRRYGVMAPASGL